MISEVVQLPFMKWVCVTRIYIKNSLFIRVVKLEQKQFRHLKKNGFRTLPLFAERVTIEVYVCDNFSHLVNELSKRRLLQF